MLRKLLIEKQDLTRYTDGIDMIDLPEFDITSKEKLEENIQEFRGLVDEWERDCRF